MIRVQLLRSWKHPYKKKPYPVGTILQQINSSAGEMLAQGIAKVYDGEYPPKQGRENKMKIKLSQLNTK